MVKRNVYLGVAEADPRRAHARDDKLFGWSARQVDAREGPMAFVEKHDPQWKLQKNQDFPDDLFDNA